MRDYFEEMRYDLQEITFEFLGGRYKGDGIMYWKPQDGFTIEARVERHGPSPPKTVEVRSLSVPKDSDYPLIRMKLSTDECAMTKSKMTVPSFIPDSRWFTIRTSRVVFFRANPRVKATDSWVGSALYKVSDRLLLPHAVEREVRLQGETIHKGSSMAGILHEEDNGLRLVGRVADDRETMDSWWSLPKSEWRWSEHRRWPTAIRDACSILSKQTIALLQCETWAGTRRRVEVRRLTEGRALGICTPFHDSFVDPVRLVHLACLLARGGKNADICRQVLWQLTEAAEASQQTKELLVATILEAILRTLYGVPFTKGLKIVQYLDRFREQYLCDKWTASCERALEARKLLRQRNAHPEWISAPGGSLSHEEMVKSVDAIISLSCFYGYMILALAGFKDLEPRFPKPHEEWGPMLTYHSGSAEDG